MEVIYDKPFCKISCHLVSECRFIHADWQGFSTSAQFRESCEEVLKLIRSRKISRVLMDGGKAKVTAPTDQKWFAEDWIPRAIAAGYRTAAVVVPADIFGSLSTKQVVAQVDKNQITTYTFDSTTDAWNWIVTT